MPDYPANTLFCNNWFYGPIMALVPVVQTGLWCSLDRTSALASCDNFATYMLFCGFYEEGCSVIKQLLVARGAASKPDNPKRLMLEAVWSRRPDLRFEVAGWPAPLSTAETERWRIANREAICTREDTSFVKESHEWRHSSEPRVAEACGRILSRPVDGKWPQEEANREALAAIEKHRALCDASKNVFPWASLTLEIGVALKIGADAARGVLERILSAPIEDHGDYFWMADSLCFDEDIAIVSSSLPAGLLGPSKADSGAACEAIVAALKQMVEHTGSLPVPLAGVAWKELLDRFAIAAYEVFDDEYVDIDSWEAILSPPASEEEIRKMNGQFKGLLPDDYKEMIALHNGFQAPDRGNHHVGGISEVCDASLADTTEVEPGLLNVPHDTFTIDPSTGAFHIQRIGCRGPGLPKSRGHTIQLYAYEGDSMILQFIVPHETWILDGDPRALPGEYRYVHVSDSLQQWASLRHYVGEMVVGLEAEVRIRREMD